MKLHQHPLVLEQACVLWTLLAQVSPVMWHLMVTTPFIAEIAPKGLCFFLLAALPLLRTVIHLL